MSLGCAKCHPMVKVKWDLRAGGTSEGGPGDPAHVFPAGELIWLCEVTVMWGFGLWSLGSLSGFTLLGQVVAEQVRRLLAGSLCRAGPLAQAGSPGPSSSPKLFLFHATMEKRRDISEISKFTTS